MAKAKKIQDYNLLYDVLRYYTDAALKLSYRQIKYVGREFIPRDGAVIFAPNHTNTLMDAMVILAIDHRPKVFVARADIFRSPMAAKILTWLKIMPIMRMRDGFEEVKKNNETIERAVDVLRDRIPFCIFPEGTHQAKHSSLPLSKGIFRIAFQAKELMPEVPLYIVPVGLRYGSFFRFRSTVRVQIGEAIDVGKFRSEHSHMAEPEQINLMRDELQERIHKSIFYIPNDEDYDAIHEICATVVKRQVKSCKYVVDGKRLKGLDAHFEANNRTKRDILRLKESNPKVAARLIQLGQEAYDMRTASHISLKSVSVKYTVLSRILKVLWLIVTLPYTLPVSALTLPINAVTAYLFTLIKDHAFRNSVRYLANLVLWPLLVVVYAVLAFVFLRWWWALAIVALLIPAPIVAQESWRLARILVSDFKLLANKPLRRKYREIKELFTQTQTL